MWVWMTSIYFQIPVLLYENQPIDLQSKLLDWFLYDRDLHHERVNVKLLFCVVRIMSTILSFLALFLIV